jgi:hypothetical protein
MPWSLLSVDRNLIEDNTAVIVAAAIRRGSSLTVELAFCISCLRGVYIAV